MLHTTNKNKEHNLNQRSSITTSLPLFTHSHLTAALRHAGDGNIFLEQLSPGGQVNDLAGWDADITQLHPAFSSDLDGSDWKYVKINQFPHCGTTTDKSLGLINIKPTI